MEKLQENANIKLFALNSNQALAQKIAAELGIKLCDASVKHFSDGEIQININESVRGDDVFIIQSISDPVNENFMELMVMMDALRRSSAGSINAVIPYYGYARADRKARSREPITAKLLANFITLAGADRVITLDLHAGQLQGFFNIPVDHLFAIYGQAEYFKAKGISEDVVVVAPDHNSVKGARNLADLLKAPIAIVDKRDDTRLDIEHSAIIGDVCVFLRENYILPLSKGGENITEVDFDDLKLYCFGDHIKSYEYYMDDGEGKNYDLNENVRILNV